VSNDPDVGMKQDANTFFVTWDASDDHNIIGNYHYDGTRLAFNRVFGSLKATSSLCSLSEGIPCKYALEHSLLESSSESSSESNSEKQFRKRTTR
jgi:hypothetical protein